LLAIVDVSFPQVIAVVVHVVSGQVSQNWIVKHGSYRALFARLQTFLNGSIEKDEIVYDGHIFLSNLAIGFLVTGAKRYRARRIYGHGNKDVIEARGDEGQACVEAQGEKHGQGNLGHGDVPQMKFAFMLCD